MKIIRSWPFITLSVVTLLVGVAWHLAGIGKDDGALGRGLFAVVSVLGAPFILAQRLARTLGESPFRPWVALIVGLAPYVIADLLLRRRRNARAVAS